MNVRRLTDHGIERMAGFLADVSKGTVVSGAPDELLLGSEYSEPFQFPVVVEQRGFATRFDLAEYLFQRFREAGAHGFERDTGLWGWLSLYYFEQLCPAGKDGTRKPGAIARWILDGNHRRYYRQNIAGPFRIYTTFRSEPDLARGLLAGPPDKQGDVFEQIASRMEYVTNRAVVGTVSRLYVGANGRYKKGAGSKGPGSPRRLADVLAQIDLTYDLYSLNAEQLIGMLPVEFERFVV